MMIRQRDLRAQRRAKEQERQHWVEQKCPHGQDQGEYCPDCHGMDADDQPSRESLT